jgi:hypothetical protein
VWQTAEFIPAKLIASRVIGVHVKASRQIRRREVAEPKLRHRKEGDEVSAREGERHIGADGDVDLAIGRQVSRLISSAPARVVRDDANLDVLDGFWLPGISGTRSEDNTD